LYLLSVASTVNVYCYLHWARIYWKKEVPLYLKTFGVEYILWCQTE